MRVRGGVVMQQMACNLQRTLRGAAPFKASPATSRGVRTSAAKPSLIRTIQADIYSRTRSAEEVTQSYLDAIAKAEPSVHAFITVEAAKALAQVTIRWDAIKDACQHLDRKIFLDGGMHALTSACTTDCMHVLGSSAYHRRVSSTYSWPAGPLLL